MAFSWDPLISSNIYKMRSTQSSNIHHFYSFTNANSSKGKSKFWKGKFTVTFSLKLNKRKNLFRELDIKTFNKKQILSALHYV